MFRRYCLSKNHCYHYNFNDKTLGLAERLIYCTWVQVVQLRPKLHVSELTLGHVRIEVYINTCDSTASCLSVEESNNYYVVM